MTEPEAMSIFSAQILGFNDHFPLKNKTKQHNTKQKKNQQTELLEKSADSRAELGKA